MSMSQNRRLDKNYFAMIADIVQFDTIYVIYIQNLTETIINKENGCKY